MIVKEIHARSILSKSKVFDYVINPYIGCQHNCTYCYARFMKRFTGHKESWGEFVDVKVNAPDLLKQEIRKKTPGRVWISGVCDSYQPLEASYELTRQCIDILVQYKWPITIQTKSDLVLRDIELLTIDSTTEVGITITTGDEAVRQLFEPNVSSIKKRVEALEELHLAGIKTFAMIAPILPKAEELVTQLKGKVDYVLIDKLNYHYGDWVYKKYSLEDAMNEDFFYCKSKELASALEEQDIKCQVLF